MNAKICIFEDNLAPKLSPLSLTRPVFDLRCGMTSLLQKIVRAYPDRKGYLMCRPHLRNVVREAHPDLRVAESIQEDACLFINGMVLFDPRLAEKLAVEKDTVFLQSGRMVAAQLSRKNLKKVNASGQLDLGQVNAERREIEANLITYPWDLINHNAGEIRRDFEFFASGGKIEGDVSDSAVLINEQKIHVGVGAKIKAGVILDAENGPIAIGKNTTVMPNAVIEGPCWIGDESTIKIGAKIYEGTSIGEVCKVGGEVEESLIHSHSNKQHDGFLGHAYLGQWVNLGADTNNSDLKNNYGSVKVYLDGDWVDSGHQFVGLFMGDHAKSGINTMFNTGTVVGAMSNIFGADFPPKFLPSFVWGGAAGLVEHELEKALSTARTVMSRRGVEMSSAYEQLIRYIFEETKGERSSVIGEQ